MQKIIGIIFVILAVLAASPMSVRIFSAQANEDALKVYRSWTMFFVWENIAFIAIVGIVLIFWDEITKPKG